MSEVETAEDGQVLVITINRPERRNAVNQAVSEGIAAALDRLDERRDLAVGVITGAGGTFCAGMDLKSFRDGEQVILSGRGFAGVTTRASAKPLIAAVEGHALAGGFEVVLACDLVVAARTARFGLPEVKRGLVAAAGGLFRLPDRLPYHLAVELILTGDPIDAEQAHQFGLVNRLTEPGAALGGALALARTVAANGPLALTASKRIIRESRDWPTAELFDRQQPLIDTVFSSADAHEGALAFLERRAPVWQAR